MEDIHEQQTSKWAKLSLLTVVFLLLATMLQAAHFCGPVSSAPPCITGVESAANAGLCMTCLMAQAATAALLLIVLVLSLLCRRPVGFVEQHPRCFLESFRLYLRPPPIY